MDSNSAHEQYVHCAVAVRFAVLCTVLRDCCLSIATNNRPALNSFTGNKLRVVTLLRKELIFYYSQMNCLPLMRWIRNQTNQMNESANRVRESVWHPSDESLFNLSHLIHWMVVAIAAAAADKYQDSNTSTKLSTHNPWAIFIEGKMHCYSVSVLAFINWQWQCVLVLVFCCSRCYCHSLLLKIVKRICYTALISFGRSARCDKDQLM